MTTERRPTRRRALWIVVATVAVVLVGPVLWVQGVGQAHLRGADGVTPFALVLGAGLKPDGSPSVSLERRLDAARALYEAGSVTTILVSGDGRRADHDEPSSRRDWRVAHGGPDTAIVSDDGGLDTHDSCVRAHDVFGVDRAVVVTQDYHLRRALFSCGAAGIDVAGVGVSARSVQPSQAALWRLREAPASWRAAWDALTGRPSQIPGPVPVS